MGEVPGSSSLPGSRGPQGVLLSLEALRKLLPHVLISPAHMFVLVSPAPRRGRLVWNTKAGHGKQWEKYRALRGCELRGWLLGPPGRNRPTGSRFQGAETQSQWVSTVMLVKPPKQLQNLPQVAVTGARVESH